MVWLANHLLLLVSLHRRFDSQALNPTNGLRKVSGHAEKKVRKFLLLLTQIIQLPLAHTHIQELVRFEYFHSYELPTINVGSTPTFRIRRRREVLLVIICNWGIVRLPLHSRDSTKFLPFFEPSLAELWITTKT